MPRATARAAVSHEGLAGPVLPFKLSEGGAVDGQVVDTDDEVKATDLALHSAPAFNAARSASSCATPSDWRTSAAARIPTRAWLVVH